MIRIKKSEFEAKLEFAKECAKASMRSTFVATNSDLAPITWCCVSVMNLSYLDLGLLAVAHPDGHVEYRDLPKDIEIYDDVAESVEAWAGRFA